jgi:hypothetical protein
MQRANPLHVFLGDLTSWERQCVQESGFPYHVRKALGRPWYGQPELRELLALYRTACSVPGETLLDFLKKAHQHVTETG